MIFSISMMTAVTRADLVILATLTAREARPHR